MMTMVMTMVASARAVACWLGDDLLGSPCTGGIPTASHSSSSLAHDAGMVGKENVELNVSGCQPYLSRYFKQVVRYHKPYFVALLETRVSGLKADSIIAKFGFCNSFRVEAQGFRGGIWLLWQDHLQVRSGGAVGRVGTSRSFASFVDDCALESWFPRYSVYLVSWIASSTVGPLSGEFVLACSLSGLDSFHLDQFVFAWLHHPDFRNFLMSNWCREETVLTNLQNLQPKLMEWNPSSFGMIGARKKWIMARLRGIDRVLQQKHSDFLSNLEVQLKTDLELLLEQEDMLWMQKSRSNCSKEEIRQVVLSMDPAKAPGVDDFHAFFYQRNWVLVGSQERLAQAIQKEVTDGNWKPINWNSVLAPAKRVDDLGRYLGVPLLHKRVTNETYEYLIQKTRDRLAEWKAKSLSFAGRVIYLFWPNRRNLPKPSGGDDRPRWKWEKNYTFSIASAYAQRMGAHSNEASEFWKAISCYKGLSRVKMLQRVSCSEGGVSGLSVAWDLEIKDVVIETDNREVCELLCQGKTMEGNSHLISHLIEMLDRPWRLQFSHTPREANQTADAMAKIAWNMPFGANRYAIPPDAVSGLLRDDAISPDALSDSSESFHGVLRDYETEDFSRVGGINLEDTVDDEDEADSETEEKPVEELSEDDEVYQKDMGENVEDRAAKGKAAANVLEQQREGNTEDQEKRNGARPTANASERQKGENVEDQAAKGKGTANHMEDNAEDQEKRNEARRKETANVLEQQKGENVKDQAANGKGTTNNRTERTGHPRRETKSKPVDSSDPVMEKRNEKAVVLPRRPRARLDPCSRRMKQYKCLTKDPSVALAIYVPYYAGLNVGRYLWDPDGFIRDYDAVNLVKWLASRAEWKRMWGRDHFLVAGRINWDFRRDPRNESDWGNELLNFDESRNMTSLDRMRRLKRRFLFSFAGARRPGLHESIRNEVIDQCLATRKRCRFLECDKTQKCHKPAYLLKLFQSSIFCLQPSGDSNTRRSIFDSIVAGCIPVFFHPGSSYVQYIRHFPKDYRKYSVFIPERDVKSGKANIERILQRVSREEQQ
ncbi:Xyloglucan galactosyltransferase KATAMARI1 [Hibiscus syriacus]|uniref:Xyloglucan galactosyltransferase KATAMARI1 n=1 Tax=Hibiscus syriacus TaxID=106335 RepID=A0A6A3CQE8_HIBSY|nr:Xyloglucan galactosyltransferase KATAMARI1 [Hibiscus syriacus]